MGNDKAYRRTGDLIDALAASQHDLAQGALDLHGLDAACENARELYERLVVLRHKVRERHSAAPPVPALPEQAGPIRLDTRPAEAPGQTSLIDAIATTEQEQAPDEGADAPAKGKARAAQGGAGRKLPGTTVDDLGKAISLNHKFWFTTELFNGDRRAFEQGVAALNAAADRQAALAHLRDEVLARSEKPPDEEAVAALKDLIERRFP